MDHMGVPLLMEPNFKDYSCQVKNSSAYQLARYLVLELT